MLISSRAKKARCLYTRSGCKAGRPTYTRRVSKAIEFGETVRR